MRQTLRADLNLDWRIDDYQLRRRLVADPYGAWAGDATPKHRVKRSADAEGEQSEGPKSTHKRRWPFPKTDIPR